ncbi:MAG TPA: tRNA epoxyqueuosine(34) reductase QueG [Longimicrobiales bacterium]|nr:tRNA epoxyqueuosine(34) reductase QueG [Longimicrobiales bacterium]
MSKTDVQTVPDDAQLLTTELKAQARRLGFELVGVTDVRPSDHSAFYRSWIAAGRHGTMAYLAREDAVARRLAPEGFRSAVVVALNYYPGDDRPADDPASAGPVNPSDAAADGSRGVIARYARGRDYHKVLKKKLLALLTWLEGELGRELPMARAYVDTGPVLERELAQRAGLGWFGHNTMLIHPRKGSYFFLGSLLLDIELAPDTPFGADHCGTCSACVSACPTGALLGRDANGAPVMDATRCISYLTIEHRGPIPRELRSLMTNRVFGCDICQEVCPWNSSKFVALTREPDFDGRERERERLRKRERAGTAGELPGTTLPSLISLMRMTYEEWDEWTRGSAIRRAGYAGLKRNVAVALGNWGAGEAVPVLAAALRDLEPVVRSHAAWALEQIGTADAIEAVRDAVTLECDAGARAEMLEALGLRSMG